MPFRPTADPKNDILSTLEIHRESSWSELLERTSLGKATLSKHIPELIENGNVSSEKRVYKGRRTTVYSILKEGEWEARRNKIVKLLKGFKLPYVYEKKEKDNRLLISLSFEFQDQTIEEKENLEKKAPKMMKIMSWALGRILNSLSSVSTSKMMLTIYFSPEAIE